ncbi:hypothetical protein ACJ72_00804 [Emergomyces africanus]|uniref:Zn(2)-C6 fungal-type domain-containing protein n=1 Tax=Emergomyces africanus TaxID=1955775 RepID=A0A1B7P704_9EURO|nr:hypothetical protein ACJ72_00804 [Emergomyces africanus]
MARNGTSLQVRSHHIGLRWTDPAHISPQGENEDPRSPRMYLPDGHPTSIQPSHGVRYSFVPVDPSTKLANGGVAYVRPRGQTEEDRRHKHMLREKGGSCIWCIQRRKPCDLEKVCAWCQDNGLPCLRNSEQIWLYATIEAIPRSRQTAMRRAKERTFIRANEVMKTFRTYLINSTFAAQNPSAPVVLHFRRLESHNLAVLAPALRNMRRNHFELSNPEKELLFNVIRSSIPFPPLPHIWHQSANSDLLLLATNIFQSVVFVIGIAGTGLHIKPPHYNLAAIAMTDFLVSVAKFIAHLADHFCSKLCTTLRPSKTKPIPQGINVAIRVYRQALAALSNFRPGCVIEQIFSDILAQVPSSLSLIDQLLSTAYFSKLDTDIPPFCGPSPFQVAVYLHSGNVESISASVSTLVELQVSPFDSIPIFTVSQLLASRLNPDPPSAPNGSTLTWCPLVTSSYLDHRIPPSPNDSATCIGSTYAETMALRYSRDRAYNCPSGVEVKHASIEHSSCQSSQHLTPTGTDTSSFTSVDDDSEYLNAEQENSVDTFFKYDEFIRDFEAGVCKAKGGVSVDSDNLDQSNLRFQTTEGAHESGLA